MEKHSERGLHAPGLEWKIGVTARVAHGNSFLVSHSYRAHRPKCTTSLPPSLFFTLSFSNSLSHFGRTLARENQLYIFPHTLAGPFVSSLLSPFFLRNTVISRAYETSRTDPRRNRRRGPGGAPTHPVSYITLVYVHHVYRTVYTASCVSRSLSFPFPEFFCSLSLSLSLFHYSGLFVFRFPPDLWFSLSSLSLLSFSPSTHDFPFICNLRFVQIVDFPAL